MTYYPDLSPYTYIQWAMAPNVVTVGWLDGQHSFPQRQPDPVVLAQLWDACCHPVIGTRGFHRCPWCPHLPEGPMAIARDGGTLSLGTSEIRVFGQDGTIYAAPDLIYHYVIDHQYRPPDVFIDTLLQGPQPGTDVYQALLTRYGWD